MIIVTGGAGFIGSNLVRKLNAMGENNIIVVDDLTDGTKFKNLVGCEILDFLDIEDFYPMLLASDESPFDEITHVFHQGACSDTTEWNGKYMMRNNYEYSKLLLHFCLQEEIPFIYASSAAVYGNNTEFSVDKSCEHPINVYAYSKWQFDQYVRRIMPAAESQIVGLRYFNVYGPNEAHKGKMASVAYHFNQQILATGKSKLFAGTEGYGDGEQLRDFVYIEDICEVIQWFSKHPDKSGIFNVGTGNAESFNAVANAVIAWHKRGEIEYIPFPDSLKGRYQSYTQADLSLLREAGYQKPFTKVADGVKKYLDSLSKLD